MNQDKAITFANDMGLNQIFCRFLSLFSLQWGVPFAPKKPGVNYYQAWENWNRITLNNSMNLKQQTIKRYALKSGKYNKIEGKLNYKSHNNSPKFSIFLLDTFVFENFNCIWRILGFLRVEKCLFHFHFSCISLRKLLIKFLFKI